jgi:TatD DNase family protein
MKWKSALYFVVCSILSIIFHLFLDWLGFVGTNLFHKDFEKSLNRTIHRAFSAGVSQSILISTNSDTIQKNLEICSKHPNSLFCVIGIHPKDVTESLNLKEIDQFEEIIKKYRNLVVGIGEIGFDSKSKEKRPSM